MTSLRSQLVYFWSLLLFVCVGLAILMLALYRNSAGVQIAQAEALTEHTCSGIAQRFRQSQANAGSSAATDQLLQVILQLALIETPHVEGGAWDVSTGFRAYAYPTYEGGGAKTDVPAAERVHIAETAQLAIQAQMLRTDIVRGAREALILTACPLATTDNDLAAWTMTRIPAFALAAYRNVSIGIGVLFAMVAVSGIWLGTILWRGYHHVRRVERALDRADDDGETVRSLQPTGVAELDRLIGAFNQFGRRLEVALTQTRQLAQQSARDERLIALGRMTSGMAHEIRNPIATMRLKAENALAADPLCHADALRTILGQTARLEELVQSLLAIVQPIVLQTRRVALRPWLDEHVASATQQAVAKDIDLILQCDIEAALIDASHLGRALDNLIDNAIHHAPPQGHVVVTVLASTPGRFAIRIDDDGPGVAPELQAHLFEPFATSRADGTGLGLALAREVAIAHGGDIHYIALAHGARFELELPWLGS